MNPGASTREERILSLAPDVRIAVWRLLRKLPAFIDRGDLTGQGWLGAIQAVDGFDEARGVELSSFAAKHIRGRMIDYLRSLEPIRGELQDRTPDPDGGNDVRRLEARLDVAALTRRGSWRLTSRQKEMLHAVYTNGRSCASVARSWGVHYTRGWQIHQQALEKLREAA